MSDSPDPERISLQQGRVQPRAGTLGDLLTRLVEDVIVLIRAELRLASSEMRGKAAAAGSSVIVIAVGFMLVSVAMVCLLAAGIAFLALYIGIVAAALVFAGAMALVGAILIVGGINKVKSLDLAPRRSIAMFKRSAETLKGE